MIKSILKFKDKYLLSAVALAVFALFFLNLHSAQAAAITSAQSGNWSDTSTWTGGVVPGNGDTVTITTGHIVTVDVNTTIGASGITGTTAVTIGNTGKLIIATSTTFTVQGDVVHSGTTADVLVMNVGSTWEWNVPAGQTYSIHPITNDAQTRKISICPGATAASARCTMISRAGGGIGFIGLGSMTAGNVLNALYTDFIRIGDANNPMFTFSSNWGAGKWDVQYSTFDTSGSIYSSYRLYDGSVFRHNYNVHRNTAANTVIRMVSSYQRQEGALWEIVGNVFDKMMGNVGAAGWAGLKIQNNYMGNGYGFNSAYGAPAWFDFSGNFIRFTANPDTGAHGDVLNNYLLADANIDNIHWSGTWKGGAQTYDGNVVEVAGSSSDEANWLLGANPSTPTTYTVQNNIILPDTGGRTSGGLFLLMATPNIRTNLLHNTGVAPTGLGFVGAENAIPQAGQILAYKSNLMWNGRGDQTIKFLNLGTTAPGTGVVADVGDPANIDYNAAVNSQLTAPTFTEYTNQGRSYISKWSTTPGAHDLADQDPQFVDTTRNLATFDTYLNTIGAGQTAAGTWAGFASGYSFATGTIVSNATSTFYGGTVINYRAIATHLKSTANSEPGAGTSWRSYWELASLYDIRQAVAAQTTYQPDSANGLSTASTVIPTLTSWVRRGYAPQNRALKAAAHDGGDIGAVAWIDANPTTVSITAPASGGTISGTQTITATATDASGITGVKFFVDYTDNTTSLIGSEDTSSPYSVSLDTTSLTDGSHTLIAVATDTYNNPATSTAITVTVSNSVASASVNTSGSRKHTTTATTAQQIQTQISSSSISNLSISELQSLLASLQQQLVSLLAKLVSMYQSQLR